MRVLLVSPLPPPSGGLATWTKDLVAAAPRAGLDTEVVNTALIGARTKLSSKKMRMIDELLRTHSIFQNLKRILKNGTYDAVHINTVCSVKGMIRDLLCVMMCKKHPVVLQCHCNVEDWIGTNRMGKWLLTQLVKRASRVLVLNTRSQKTIFSITGKDSLVMPNFIDFSPEKPKAAIRDDIRNVIYVGRVRIEKGIAELLQMAALYPNICFTVIGSVDEEAQELERPANVAFLGEQEHGYIAEALAKADVFLFPSHSEGFSIALLEAMAAGLPVVATDVGANRDMLEQKGGILVSVQAPKEIAAAIAQMESKEVRTAMARFNRDKVATRYSTEAVLKKLVEVYAAVKQ